MEMDKVTVYMKCHTALNKMKIKNENKGIVLDVNHQIALSLVFFFLNKF